jgi:regulator of protease activity HflC (stomatin/prohibitin superfamily)
VYLRFKYQVSDSDTQSQNDAHFPGTAFELCGGAADMHAAEEWRRPMDTPNAAPPPGPEPHVKADAREIVRRLLERIPRKDFRIPWRPIRRLLLAALLVWGAVQASRFIQRSFQAVPPGNVGVCVSRFTGSLAALAPGTHFRPPALYQIHLVRISDQILAGAAGSFNVSTKEGVVAQVTVQARWSIDRAKLLSRWAALPADPERELVAPVIAAAFRTAAPRYEVTKLVSEKREELALVAAATARERLAESGVILKEVLIGDLVLPQEFERGRVAMVDEVQNTERLDVTLKRKVKEVEKTRLEAEAQKARQIQEAEAAAAQRVIAARGEADAMKYILSLKEKEIQQKKLEAEADRQTRVQRAHAEAEVTKIQALAEVERRKSMADAEAYSIRTTSLAEFEGLEREAELVSANPLLIPKTFADHISDKVQVILTPSIGGEAFTGEVLRRAANGQSPVAERPAAPISARSTKTASRSTKTASKVN